MHWLCGTDAGLVAGLGAFLGHVFPVWLGFKGGKGVATYIGVLIALAWLVALAVWRDLARGRRADPLFVACRSGRKRADAGCAVVFRRRKTALLFAVLTAIVWVMHRGNIQRLIAGTEGKIRAQVEICLQRSCGESRWHQENYSALTCELRFWSPPAL